MSLPRLFATGLWLAATVVSTFLVWTATSIVAADVTDRPAPVIDHDDVVSELQGGSPDPRAAPTVPPPPPRPPPPRPVSPTSTAPSPGPGALPVGPRTVGPAAPPPQPELPLGTIAPVPPTPTPGTPRSPAPVSPTTTPPARPTATYATSGGVVQVSCNGFFIELISAIPSNGYAVRVAAGGPGNVDVHFERSGEDLSVKAVCFGQPIRYYDQRPPPRQAQESP